jgi:hypothetical protein
MFPCPSINPEDFEHHVGWRITEMVLRFLNYEDDEYRTGKYHVPICRIISDNNNIEYVEFIYDQDDREWYDT